MRRIVTLSILLFLPTGVLAQDKGTPEAASFVEQNDTFRQLQWKLKQDIQQQAEPLFIKKDAQSAAPLLMLQSQEGEEEEKADTKALLFTLGGVALLAGVFIFLLSGSGGSGY